MHDIIIVGGGPAGCCAGIYLARYKLDSAMVAKGFGKIGESHLIENYPGIESISGLDLVQRMQEHAKKAGVKIIYDEATRIIDNKDHFEIVAGKKKIKCKAVLFAMGLATRKLNIKGEKELSSKGVSYCYTCDAPQMKGKVSAVVGGGNGAAHASLLLADYSKKVYLFYRGDKLKADPILVDRIKENSKIEIVYKSNVKELEGEKSLEKAKVDVDGKMKEYEIQGLFIEIGSVPSDVLIKDIDVETDKAGFIKVGDDQSTNVEGVYAAGDITNGSNKFMQISTAVGEGAVASASIFKYLLSKKASMKK